MVVLSLNRKITSIAHFKTIVISYFRSEEEVANIEIMISKFVVSLMKVGLK